MVFQSLSDEERFPHRNRVRQKVRGRGFLPAGAAEAVATVAATRTRAGVTVVATTMVARRDGARREPVRVRDDDRGIVVLAAPDVVREELYERPPLFESCELLGVPPTLADDSSRVAGDEPRSLPGEQEGRGILVPRFERSGPFAAALSALGVSHAFHEGLLCRPCDAHDALRLDMLVRPDATEVHELHAQFEPVGVRQGREWGGRGRGRLDRRGCRGLPRGAAPVRPEPLPGTSGGGRNDDRRARRRPHRHGSRCGLSGSLRTHGRRLRDGARRGRRGHHRGRRVRAAPAGLHPHGAAAGAPDLDGRAGRAEAVAGPHGLICPRDAGGVGGENENEHEAELVYGGAPWETCTAISRIRSMRGAIVTITTAVAPMLIGAARFGNGCHHPKSVSMGR